MQPIAQDCANCGGLCKSECATLCAVGKARAKLRLPWAHEVFGRCVRLLPGLGRSRPSAKQEKLNSRQGWLQGQVTRALFL